MEILKKTASVIVSIMLMIMFSIYIKSMVEFIFVDGWSGSSIAINFIKFNLIILSSFAGSIIGCWLLFVLGVKLFQSVFNQEINQTVYESGPTTPIRIELDSAESGGGVSIDDSIINRVGELTLQFLESQSLNEFDLNDYSNIMFKLFAFMNVRGVEFPSERVSDKRNYIESCLSKFTNFEIKNSRVKLVTIQSNKEKMDAVYSDKKQANLGWQTIDEEEKKMRSRFINGVITEEDLKDYFENRVQKSGVE